MHYLLEKKMSTLSLSLLIFYSFFQINFRLMNHCVFYNSILGEYILVLYFLVPITNNLSPSNNFGLILFELVFSNYFGSEDLYLYQNTTMIMHFNMPINYLSNTKKLILENKLYIIPQLQNNYLFPHIYN